MESHSDIELCLQFNQQCKLANGNFTNALKVVDIFNQRLMDNGTYTSIWNTVFGGKHEQVALELLHKGFVNYNPGFVFGDKFTLLHNAIHYNMVTFVSELIETYTAEELKIGHVRPSGFNAFAHACYKADMNHVAIKMFTKFGKACNPTQITKDGKSALSFACDNKFDDVVTMLLNMYPEQELISVEQAQKHRAYIDEMERKSSRFTINVTYNATVIKSFEDGSALYVKMKIDENPDAQQLLDTIKTVWPNDVQKHDKMLFSVTYTSEGKKITGTVEDASCVYTKLVATGKNAEAHELLEIIKQNKIDL